MKTAISLRIATAHWAVAVFASFWLAASAQAQEAVTVNYRDIPVSYPAEAVVEAVRQATVAAQVAGRIVEVHVDAGQRVRKGELLMRIDAREEAENSASAQAQLVQAKSHFERTKELLAKKFVSQAALDQAQAAYLAAKAAAGASGATLSHATVRSPITGIVAQRLTELGEMASPGKPLVTIYDPKDLRVLASIPQYKLSEIKQGIKARLEFPDTGKWIDAARVEVLPTADIRTHTVTARLYLPDGVEGVIPGMAARAHFIVGTAKKLTVPPKAILRRGEVTGLYVLDDKNVPHLRQIRLGEIQANGEIEVLAGLSGSERVALDPIAAGMKLKQAANAD
jgi:membrane fusion protein, multidrug efflux system